MHTVPLQGDQMSLHYMENFAIDFLKSWSKTENAINKTNTGKYKHISSYPDNYIFFVSSNLQYYFLH